MLDVLKDAEIAMVKKYTSVDGELQKPKQHKQTKSDGNLSAAAKDDGEDEAFQTMGSNQLQVQVQETPDKVRMVPRMTIYLSRVAIPGLKTQMWFVISGYLA